jgi:hypothetical protein
MSPAIAATALVADQMLSPTSVVPSSLLTVAEGPVLRLASVLSDEHIPAGLETTERLYREFRPKGTIGAAGTMPLMLVLDRFNRTHPEMVANSTDGVFVMRTIRGLNDPTSMLNQRVSTFSVNDVMLDQAFANVRRIFDSSVRVPVGDGIAGSFPGGIESRLEELDRLRRLRVSVLLRNTTVLEILNAIVRAAPGTVWTRA